MKFVKALIVPTLIAALMGLSPALFADDLSQVAINGQVLTVQQLRALEDSIGSRIAAGAYVVDGSGCWANLSNGTSGCLGGGITQYHSRYGSGERTSDGSWNHYSNSAGTGVGGTSDGCIYTTTGWSNC